MERPERSTRVVSDAEVQAFTEDGFVVIGGLLTEDELDRYGDLVAAAVADRQSDDHRSLAEKSRYEQSFQQCQNLWEDHLELRPLTFHPRVGEAAARLLQVDAVRLWHDQALFKEPGGRLTDAHQDQPYWPIAETDTVTAWIPFDGSTLENGAMGYLPGSHRIGLRRFVNIFFGEAPDFLSDPELAESEPRFVEVPRGSVAFHHGLTAHLAGPNRTSSTRRVHTMIYFADGCTRGGATHPHPSVDRAGIEPGAEIDSEVTPVVWPRPDGSLPPTPTI
jgi:hypothetical protein